MLRRELHHSITEAYLTGSCSDLALGVRFGVSERYVRGVIKIYLATSPVNEHLAHPPHANVVDISKARADYRARHTAEGAIRG